MIRISLLAIVSVFFLLATLGCGESAPPEREKGKTAATDREQNESKEKAGGKFMRPRGGPVGAPGGKQD